ncbi:hypothetical protein [Chitinimonas lacunae]|uniref:Uncharacterized protein n=1 Tax=Chitinimonas lacunae TaxID=1963018 RepID=A0ABV8MJG6_9NEIS
MVIRSIHSLQRLPAGLAGRRFHCRSLACPACQALPCCRRFRAATPAPSPRRWRAPMGRQWRLHPVHLYIRPGPMVMARLGLLYGHPGTTDLRERWLVVPMPFDPDGVLTALQQQIGWGYLDRALTQAAVPTLTSGFSYGEGRRFACQIRSIFDPVQV